jgi:Putative peptidoglycan binding domain
MSRATLSSAIGRIGLLMVIAVLSPPAAAGAAGSPLAGTALWVDHAVPAAQLASEAAQADVHTLFVKAAESTTPEPQFTAGLIAQLHEAGLTVCAWTFVYGGEPAAEAAAALSAVADGARCLVVDAEGQYDGRYGAAQIFLHALRAQLGPRFPIGLAGQAEILQHPTFPYSVFLGPGGFSFDMPQIYWRDLGLTVGAAFRATIAVNQIYGRPLAPVGQLYGAPAATELEQFQTLAAEYGADGTSFFDLDAAEAGSLPALLPRPTPTIRRVVVAPTIRPGADGDEIVWAQELLNGAGARLPVGGFFGAQTARAIVGFQRRHHLRRSGLLDAPTWRALLRFHAREPSWAAQPPDSAG